MSNAVVIKEFLVSLGFEVDEKSFNNFSSGLASASKKAMAFGAVMTAVAGAVVAGVNKVAQSYDELGDLSDRVNASAKDIKELGYIAQMSDSSIEAVNASLQGYLNQQVLLQWGLDVVKKYLRSLVLT